MGALLPKPVTDKRTSVGHASNDTLHYACSAMQGWRQHMEDAAFCKPNVSEINSLARQTAYYQIKMAQHWIRDVLRPAPLVAGG